MAKKRRIISKKEKEPEYEFVPPDFDEKEFILKDMYGTKITLITFVLAIIVGVCAGFIQKSWEWYGGLLLMVAVGLLMRPILQLVKFDTALIETKSMIGNYLMYILLAIGVWVLMINAPFV